MNLRQVHLDFHTSEKIEGIGKSFDKGQFQKALVLGHVDSITLFSKCHHGWSYHPSKVNDMHPNLKFDLLAAQIEAAHEIGVKTPIYLSAGLDEKYAIKHQNHLARNSDQSTTPTKSFLEAGYHRICMNTSYLDLLLAQIKEVLENYDADGIFLDICLAQPCYCQNCMNQLIAEGKDIGDESAVIELAERVYKNYTKRVRETIDSVRPGLPVFHNGGHIHHGRRDFAFANTHLELESLPTGGYGYDHFQISAAYARTLGMEYIGMTGKFHTSWGEFGGFKHPNALKYETSISIANGAGCSIGDQLHPYGSIDMATYELIGKAYEEVEKKEEYIKGSTNIADIAVLSTEALNSYYKTKSIRTTLSSLLSKSNKGCARILIEGNYLFDYVDVEADLSKYKIVILPDRIVVDEFISNKLKTFVKAGGKILSSGVSGTNQKGDFVFDFGCDFNGESEFAQSYIRPNFELESLGNSAYIIYSKSYNISNVNGEVLANRENPFFNRTAMHYSSHKHTPNNPDNSVGCIALGTDGVYIGYDIFEEYAEIGSIAVKEIVCGVIDRLLTEKKVKTNLPAQGVITVTRQEGREIVHLIYGSPVKRGNNVEIIEDIIPIYNTKVSLKFEKEPKRVYLAPQNTEIDFTYNNGYTTFKVDEFECHQMIAIDI